MAMLDEAHYWAETQFGAAELGDIRRTGRLVSTMAAIARAPDESLPRQLGSLAGAKAAYRLFDGGAVTRDAAVDRVRAALERLHADAVLRQLDLEIVVDLAPEPR